MATERGKQLVLGALIVALAVIGYRTWTDTSAAPAATSNSRASSSGATGAAPATGMEPPDVHVDALEQQRPRPSGHERNLFRFKPKAAPPSTNTARPTAPTAPVAPPAAVPTGPPPPPPIPLKFIGVMDRGAGQPKIAVLTDGIGPPVYGIEGGTVAGKYRILRIGAESIEMAYLDGRGRQTIRLSGS